MKTVGRQSNPVSGHERKDADPLGLTMVAAFLLLMIAICCLVVFGLLGMVRRAQSERSRGQVETTDQSTVFPWPRLQPNPQSDLQTSKEATKRRLSTYGWIDRKAGVARIPIDRAMQLLLEHGLPEVGGGQTRLQLMQARPQTNPRPKAEATP